MGTARLGMHDTQPLHAGPTIRVTITLEVLIYTALALLTLVVRLAALDRAPLDDAEARQALAALRSVQAAVPGAALVADSPLLHTLNALTFGLTGSGTETAARLPAVIGGVLLVLAPALWRRHLNPLPPLILSGLLAISPVGLLASRTSSPAVWSMLLVLVIPWLVLRHAETRQPAPAIAATAGTVALVLLIEPAGFVALLALAFGVLFAALTSIDDETDTVAGIRALARTWPWVQGLIAGAALVLILGTGLFWVPAGLTTVGQVLREGLRGLLERPAGTPPAFPAWVALRYEPGIVLFGLLAVYFAIRDGGFFERTLAGWSLGGLAWAVAYAGGGAAHALWIVVPLAALVALTITRWLTEHPSLVRAVPAWGVPLHALLTFALWNAIGLSVVLLGKLVLYDVDSRITELDSLVRALSDGLYSRNPQQPQTVYIQGAPVWDYVLGYIQLRAVVTVLVTLLNAVLFFLMGSLWDDARPAWRGFALGTLGFLLLIGAGLGGRAAFGTPGDPREYWHRQPVTRDVYELRATLREMSLRATGEPNLIDVAAQVPDDGAIAWALRDFPRARFVDGLGAEVNSAVVLAPADVPRAAMGAAYVGKDLVIRQAWDLSALSWKDVIAWVYKGDSFIKPAPAERLMVWVRKDVYGVEQVTDR